MLRLPVVMLNSRPEASLPGVSLTNGPIVRATSRWLLVSMRTTRRPEVGHHPRRRRAGHGPGQVEHLDPVERRPTTAVSGCRRDGDPAGRPRSSSALCSPRRGARPRRIGATSDERTHGPGAVTGSSREQLVVDAVEVLPRAANCGAVHHVPRRGDRGDQQRAGACRLEQLGLRLGGAERRRRCASAGRTPPAVHARRRAGWRSPASPCRGWPRRRSPPRGSMSSGGA